MDREIGDAFTVTVLTAPDAPSVVIVLGGDIDMMASTVLSDALRRLAGAAATAVVMDLDQITFAGATLLNFVAGVYRGMPANSVMSLCRPGTATRRLLLIAGMDRIATLRTDLPASPSSARSSSGP